MIINLLDFIPKSIESKEVIVGLSGEKFLIGKKIKDFNDKIIDVKIKDINDKENPSYKILKALSSKDMELEELVKNTSLTYDNLRWYLMGSKNSLLNESLVLIKERKFFPHKRTKGGVVKIIFSLTDRGKIKMATIQQKINLPKRKELVTINTNGTKFVLSSWWSSWLKPDAEDLKFDKIKQRFLWRIPKDYIIIQYKKSKNVLYSTILPKEIKVDDEKFITSLGLLLGEMRTRKGDISFSNTEPFLANYVLSSLKYFGLRKENFIFSIQINTKNSEPNKEEVINYWSKELKIEKEKICKIFEYKDYGTKRSKLGRIDFIYYNIILKEILNNLISYLIEEAKNNKDYAVYLIRGLLASEGYVSPSKCDSLGRVGISSQSEKNKNHIKEMLNNLNMTSSISKHDVRMTSKDNFNKIIKYDLLKISKDKEKFKILYKNFKYSKDKLIFL